VLLHCLTVRETFLVAAKLRLPGSVPTAEKEQVVEQVIQELGLVKAANTKIGNSCALTAAHMLVPCRAVRGRASCSITCPRPLCLRPRAHTVSQA